jgi:glutamate synthase domain-containing protein 1/glutamate synthase domain-containing protein 3
MIDAADRIIQSRAELLEGKPRVAEKRSADEGGCGVTGFACSIPVRGRHIYEPSVQMHNRGNGKGGGIAAAGLVAEDVGVSQDVLDSHYLLQIALLDPKARSEVEQAYIAPNFEIALSTPIETVSDFREAGLEVRPPDVQRYLGRVKPAVLTEFAERNGLTDLPEREVEDEFVYRNSVRLNESFYASLGEQRAFVLSHGRNLMVFKVVGYAEQIVQYYQLGDVKAHVWIAHQRYPTKGRVWHPGGAHPFVGLNEALVHNGDFANYHSVAEYLLQRNIRPQFLTDTEVSALLFDLWSRVYKYPLEYVIEALAPTTERDFDQLPEEKQRLYRRLQAAHIHGSPDGPWFFIIARSLPDEGRYQLLGITDTAMLRPQVFALADGEVQVGLICSEKQAIDATLRSLAAEDPRFCPVADRYWNARGGSHTDGGAFLFNVEGDGTKKTLSCTDKFGRPVSVAKGTVRCDIRDGSAGPNHGRGTIRAYLAAGDAKGLFEYTLEGLPQWEPQEVTAFFDRVVDEARQGEGMPAAIEALTLLRDRRCDTGNKRRSSLLRVIDEALEALFQTAPSFGAPNTGSYRRIGWETRSQLVGPEQGEETLIVNVEGFPPEGDDCDAMFVRRAYELGWRRFISYGYRGQRFAGCGLGPESDDVRIDVYGSSGDYLASGIDGLAIYVHGNAQDQLGQIMNRGKVVVYGDVGQTFLYGAKGGDTYVMGNAAGRPLINAVGKPRVVINGTCLDFLAESFMAGDPLDGGGFAIVNGMEFDDKGRAVPQPVPYPGSNLFSLASGGAIYIRDPKGLVDEAQLNGGELGPLTEDDWLLIRPYLEENERLFGVQIDDLLTVDGERREPEEVYRKVSAVKLEVLAAKGQADDESDE